MEAYSTVADGDDDVQSDAPDSGVTIEQKRVPQVADILVISSTVPGIILLYTLRRDSSIHCLSSSQTDFRISSFYYHAQNAVLKLHLNQPLKQHA